VIFHLCSHFGDIEIEDAENDQALIRFYRLTPMERESLDNYLTSLDLERSGERGQILVPQTVAEAGDALSGHLHDGDAMISAIKFSTGDVAVTKKPFLEWFKGLKERWVTKLGKPKDDSRSKKATPADVRKPDKPFKPEAAVQTPVPRTGCPMPDYTELKEAKAAGVVRKFLKGQQVEDFARQRAFITRGGDSGHIYRVTSRWSPDVEKFGVLYDVTQQRRICAQNKTMPPSEEVLSMKFAVEHFEREFRGNGYNRITDS